jgi:putative endonuclease
MIRMLRSLLFRWLSQTRGKLSRGEAGERLAERYLVREKGFKRIARNWRNPQDRREEIDLVMKDGEVLVFVEVKTRALNAKVPGYHAVNPAKRKILRRGIAGYLRGLAPPPPTYRLDVVEVGWPADGDDTPPRLRHIERVALKPSR